MFKGSVSHVGSSKSNNVGSLANCTPNISLLYSGFVKSFTDLFATWDKARSAKVCRSLASLLFKLASHVAYINVCRTVRLGNKWHLWATYPPCRLNNSGVNKLLFKVTLPLVSPSALPAKKQKISKWFLI